MTPKKIVSVILALCFLLSTLSVCGGSPKVPTPSGGASPSGSPTDPFTTPDPLTDDTSTLGPPALEGFLQTGAPKIGVPGTDFPIAKTSPPDDWGDMPVPRLNPLGGKALYSNSRYQGKGDVASNLSYLEGTSEVVRTLQGSTWDLNFSKTADLTPGYLRWYADQQGATLYENTDDRVTFSLRDGEDLWWAMATWGDPALPDGQMKIVRQPILSAGKTLVVEPSDFTGGIYCFSTISKPGEFMTAFVDIAGGVDCTADLLATQSVQTGLLRREFSYSKRMIAKNCRKYSLDDIPQTDQVLFWRIMLPAQKYWPDSISIRFEKTGTLSPVTIGDRLGSIRVSGAPGGATVGPQSGISRLEYADGFTYGSIIDAEGNQVFCLPAGYYNVRANLPGGGTGGIRMVPVIGGQQTDVILPTEFKSTYSALEGLFGSFASNIGSIAILDNKDLGTNAEVSILVNDPLKRDVFPEKTDVTILEGGMKGEILDIRREPALANVVLVLDTSGSMKDYMAPTIDAAKKFVQGLPDGTGIRLVSFAQTIKEHPGTGKEAVLTALGTLSATGNTALYDATAKGLTMLAGKDKAFLVVFSDGADSREQNQSMQKRQDQPRRLMRDGRIDHDHEHRVHQQEPEQGGIRRADGPPHQDEPCANCRQRQDQPFTEHGALSFPEPPQQMPVITPGMGMVS